ncbi:hypothetical protein ES703_106500 [subsurface metagenome]
MEKEKNNFNFNEEKEKGVAVNQAKPFFVNKDISVHKKITLHDRVRVLLLRRGISQNKLADEIGITAQTLSKILNSHWIPTSQIKIKISQALDVDSLVIFGAMEYWQEWREKVGYPQEENKNG